MGGDDKFRMNTFLFCLVFFLVLSGGHVLALWVKGSMEISELQGQLNAEGLDPGFRAQLESNLDNASNIDFGDVLFGFGSILFGIDLPLPFMILLTSVNSLLLIMIAVVIWSFIKAHIPFISG